MVMSGHDASAIDRSDSTADGAGLTVEGAVVRFGPLTAVDEVSLRVEPGEVVALVGPSGCGKSTLLRAVAALETLDAGTVRWDGTDLARTPVNERGFGLMFQDHALFPHRDVAANIGFGLKVQNVPGPERQARVTEVLDLVGLSGFEDRTIDTLSGGEAQRVALARALAPSPRLLMLDEPLGSLDRKLRERLAQDLRSVLGGLGLAAIHVTHDQEEAYAVADRLVVMREGAVVREGRTAEVWANPQSTFVAHFLGHENILGPGEAITLGVGDGTTSVVVRESAVTIEALPATTSPIEHHPAVGLGLPDPPASADPAGPTDPTPPTASSDPARPTNPTVPISSAVPTSPTGPTDPPDSSARTTRTSPSPSESDDPTGPTGPTSTTGPTGPTGPTGSAATGGVDDAEGFEAVVREVRFRGATSHVVVELGPSTGDQPALTLSIHSARPPAVGSTVWVRIDPTHVLPLPRP